LVVGVLLLIGISLGPNAGVFDAYRALALLIPPMGLVRAPAAMFSAAHPLACILAGLGAAGLLRLVPPPQRGFAAVALVAVAVVSTFSVHAGGQGATVVYSAVGARPGEPALDFLEEVAALGGEGPVLETGRAIYGSMGAAPPIMLSPYHRMQTSVCHASFRPRRMLQIHRHGESLNDPRSARALYDAGFRMILVRPGSRDEGTREIAARAEAASRSKNIGLRLLHEDAGLAAYTLYER
jgi:hypothetical protein